MSSANGQPESTSAASRLLAFLAVQLGSPHHERRGEAKDTHGKVDEDAPGEINDDLIRRLGRQKFEELTLPQTDITVEPNPFESEALEWLDIDQVKGEFDEWWHQRLNEAEKWNADARRVLIMKRIAELLDCIFPETSNHWNPTSRRPAVREDQLLDHLTSSHGLTLPWIGNTTLVAARHYLQVRDEDFERATRAVSKAVQNAVQQAHATGRNGSQAESDEGAANQVLPSVANKCDSVQESRVPPEGAELTHRNTEKTQSAQLSAAESGACRAQTAYVGADLQAIIDAWHRLDQVTKADVLVIIRKGLPRS